MAKKATFTLRLDEDLKLEAQQTLEHMGIPMSLAIEMFLRQIVAKGKLPFALGDDDDGAVADRERRERDFWKSFILWYFKVWPHFGSPELSRKALEEFGFNEIEDGACFAVQDYLQTLDDANDHEATDWQRAIRDVYRTQTLLSEAKELIYWALDMERTFVPSLADRYGASTDIWQYRYLAEQRRIEEEDDLPIASGVIGARYFDVDECGEEE